MKQEGWKRRTDCSSISLNSSMAVVNLDVLVPHKRPSWEIVPVELKRPFEVLDRLERFASRRVEVACHPSTHPYPATIV
jgi:hypothetical protein